MRCGPKTSLLTALAAVGVLVASVAGATPEARVVAREEILRAMRHSQGYDLCATANGPRLQVEVLLHLIREAEATDPERRPLHIGHREWYEAFLERTKRPPDRAPLYVRLSHEVGQDLVADYRRENVIEEVVAGPEPETVANIRISWPDLPGKPEKFSFEDLGSDPHLKVTEKRLIHYRLVDYGDRVWHADVHGLHGRPTSGALGLLFKVLGEARMLESWSTCSADGLRVVRGTGQKLGITRTGTVTIWPDGHAIQWIPEDRPDLRALVRRLKEPAEIRFRPLDDGS